MVDTSNDFYVSSFADVQEKSPHPIPEYVTERYEHDYEYHDEEHEKWQGKCEYRWPFVVKSQSRNII